MRKICLPVVSALLFLGAGCAQPVPPPPSPNVFYCRIKKDGVPLADTVMSQVQLYYYDNGRAVTSANDINKPYGPKYDDTLLIRPLPATATLLYSVYLTEITRLGFNTLYLKYPGGDIDTLYVERGNLTEAQSLQDLCQCTDPFTRVMFNGQAISGMPGTTLTGGKPVYEFEK